MNFNPLKETKINMQFFSPTVDGHKAVFHTANLTKVELVQLFNKMCEDKAVKLPPTTEKNIGDNKKGKKRR